MSQLVRTKRQANFKDFKRFGAFNEWTPRTKNSYLLYEYKTPFCRTRFLEHEERSDQCYKQTSATKWLINVVFNSFLCDLGFFWHSWTFKTQSPNYARTR
jgi:hypothetical protein